MRLLGPHYIHPSQHNFHIFIEDSTHAWLSIQRGPESAGICTYKQKFGLGCQYSGPLAYIRFLLYSDGLFILYYETTFEYWMLLTGILFPIGEYVDPLVELTHWRIQDQRLGGATC